MGGATAPKLATHVSNWAWPIVPPLAAIANAVYDATGLRMNSLPISPPKLLDRLLEE